MAWDPATHTENLSNFNCTDLNNFPLCSTYTEREG